jgi:hypothetical protein
VIRVSSRRPCVDEDRREKKLLPVFQPRASGIGIKRRHDHRFASDHPDLLHLCWRPVAEVEPRTLLRQLVESNHK